MSNGTKTGFWQTIPGLMTATAGVLSAATGAIVALNQTGVVDFKQMTGAKPAAQSAPAETPPAPSPVEQRSSETKPTADKVVEKHEPAPSAAAIQPEPVRRQPSAPKPVAEAKESQPVPPPSPPPTTIVRKPEPQAGTSAPEIKKQEPLPPPLPVPDNAARQKPMHERVADARRQAGSSDFPATTPTDSARRPVEPERAAIPTMRSDPPEPSDARTRDDSTRRPGAPHRVAEARNRDEPPPPPQPVQHDQKTPKGVRQDPDEPRNVGKAKAPDTARDNKPTELRGDGKREMRQTPGDTKKTEPAPPPSPAAAGSSLALVGLKMTVPAAWVKEEVQPSPMGPVAVFKIPKANGGDDGAVRITHYPNMKGKEMDERNIDRWVGQVTKPDGSPMTRADAKVTTAEVGAVRLTIVDMTGAVKMTMRDAAKPNHRMIAAIVDHPKGPHFVVAGGPTASMEKWAKDIDAFLKSAKVE
jgi:hypothetical protein